jgi:hypothetical protein
MSKKNHQITAAVFGHWLIGNLPLADFRIQEVLNDSRTDFLTLTDVEVHPLSKRECVSHLPQVIIPKGKLEFVIVPTSRHEAPEKRWNNLAAKTPFQAFAMLSGYRIWGELHLPKEPDDIHFVFTHQLSQFFALTRASVSLDPRGESQLSAPLLLANKESVSCLHIGQFAQTTGRDTEQQSSGLYVLA